jgi:hypothetical protein
MGAWVGRWAAGRPVSVFGPRLSVRWSRPLIPAFDPGLWSRPCGWGGGCVA